MSESTITLVQVQFALRDAERENTRLRVQLEELEAENERLIGAAVLADARLEDAHERNHSLGNRVMAAEERVAVLREGRAWLQRLHDAASLDAVAIVGDLAGAREWLESTREDSDGE